MNQASCWKIFYPRVLQYVEDRAIFFAHNDTDEIQRVLSMEMDIIGQYFWETELTLNFKKWKTESMLFGIAKGLNSHGRDLNIHYKAFFILEYLGNTG